MNQQRLSGNKSRAAVKEIEEIRMNYMAQPQHSSINTQHFISKASWGQTFGMEGNGMVTLIL